MKPKARKAHAHTRQVERRSRKQRAMKAQYKPRTVPKSARVPVRRQPQRGMPKLVTQAINRMIGRHKLLTLPRPADDAQEAA